MSCCHCRHEPAETPRRRIGIVRTLLQVVLLYVVAIFAGGTLIQSGHPMAVEIGRIIHLVTFVEPLTEWAHGAGLEPVADGLHTVSGGFPIQRLIA